MLPAPCCRFGQGAEECLLVQRTAARHGNAQPDKWNPGWVSPPTQLTSQALWAAWLCGRPRSPGHESRPPLPVVVGIKRSRLLMTS